MPTFEMKIEISGAAFEDNPGELARIVADTAEALRYDRTEGYLRDVNGNRVGHFAITEDAES
jgi:hypothetical protein